MTGLKIARSALRHAQHFSDPVNPLQGMGSTNKAACGVKLLPTTILAWHVCTLWLFMCFIENTTTLFLLQWMVQFTFGFPPTLNAHPWYWWSLEKSVSKSSSGIHVVRHQGDTVAWIFQMVFLEIWNMQLCWVFANQVTAKTWHNCVFYISRNTTLKYSNHCSSLMPYYMYAKFTE